jgi:hypothetical protein
LIRCVFFEKNLLPQLVWLNKKELNKSASVCVYAHCSHRCAQEQAARAAREAEQRAREEAEVESARREVRVVCGVRTRTQHNVVDESDVSQGDRGVGSTQRS